MRKIVILALMCLALFSIGSTSFASADDEDLIDAVSSAVIVPGTVLSPIDDETPTSDVDSTPCPESYAEPEDYDPESNCIDPNEVVETDEENTASVAEMCAQWNSPSHGDYALDVGDVDDNYTNNMNDICGPDDVASGQQLCDDWAATQDIELPVEYTGDADNPCVVSQISDEPTDVPTEEPTDTPSEEPAPSLSSDIPTAAATP